MPNVILHKRNGNPGAVPSTGLLSRGELAINTSDGKLYTKNVNDTIINLPVTSINGALITPASGNFSSYLAVNNIPVVLTSGDQTIFGSKSFAGQNDDSAANYGFDIKDGGSFYIVNSLINSVLELRSDVDTGSILNKTILHTNPPDNGVYNVFLPYGSGTLARLEDLEASNFFAGSGLQGGGNLSSSRSFDIGEGDGITVLSDSISVNNTVVRTTGAQIISGIKTFSSIPIFSGAYSNGQLLIGSGNSLTLNTLTAGTGIGISNGAGNITIDITGLPSSILSQTSLSGIAGIDIQYHSIDDVIVISSTGLSYVGHKHLLEDINVLSDFSMSSFRITNLSTPVSGNDATNKTYVDSRFIQLGTTQINLGSSNSKSIISGLDLDGGSP